MSFEKAVEHVLAVEGGLVDHPSDPGGLTNMGISLRSYPHLGRDGIRNLTREQAVEIYRQNYWLPLGCDQLESRLGLLVFDAGVNHGVARAKRWLRDHPTFHGFMAHRIRFYTRLSTWSSFGRGWMNRLAHLLDALATAKQPVTPGGGLLLVFGTGNEEVARFPMPQGAQVVTRAAGDRYYVRLEAPEGR